MSSRSLLTRLIRPFILAGGLASAVAATADAKPYVEVCNGTVCVHHSSLPRGGQLYYYVTVGTSPISHYNIRFKSGHQFEIESATNAIPYFSKTTILRVKPGATYAIGIQACYRRFLSSSSCTAWRTVTFTAPK